ncbi:MAG: flagellar biosynthetic protein FliO [Xanthomonadales bacterium]|jgi:flagellar protein FliO/FliZ|nr:flagellar biosynthetic protein FliO [Xanthomonadales bacterium]
MNCSAAALRALIILCPAAASAADADPSLGASALQMLVGLTLVVAVILGSLWLLKRLSMPRGSPNGVLRVVGGTAVGPRERVLLLEIGDTWLVVGVAPGRVATLHRLPRMVAPDPAPGNPPEPARDFRAWLENVIERKHERRP